MDWKVIAGKGGAWSIHQCLTREGMEGLRELFPDGTADELNFVLFSTSGVSGSYTTIEECERSLAENPEEPDSVSFVVISPRILRLHYGNCRPETADDFEYLRRLRKTSHAAISTIGL